MADKFMTIDASSMASFNYAAFLAEYFAPTEAANGSATWLDTVDPVSFMGGTFYYHADEFGIRYNTSSTTANDKQILVEGENMGYDVDGFHTYYGSVDSIRFATYDSSTQYLQDGTERTRMFNAIEGLVVSGLDIDVAMAKNEKQAEKLASNEFYDLYNYLRHTNGTNGTTDVSDIYIEKLYEIFGAKAQNFIGSEGEDVYTGTKFGDRIDGGAGIDTLTGGLGKDLFIFDLGDSAATTEDADLITDFMVKKDRIDLHLIDTNANKAGDQAFKFIGENDFTGKAGQVSYERVDGVTHVYLDIDGDSVADMTINLTGELKLSASDFIL